MSEDVPAVAEPQPTVGILDLAIAGIADFAASTVRDGLTSLMRTHLEPVSKAPPTSDDPQAQEPVNAGSHAPVIVLALVGVAVLATVLAQRKSR